MAFDWKEYFTYAEKIYEDSCVDECLCRIGISRFYYAAFNISKDFAQNKNIPPYPGGGAHEGLWLSFQGNADSKIKKVGTLGSSIKGLRHIADYKARQIIDKRDLDIAYLAAKEILKICEES